MRRIVPKEGQIRPSFRTSDASSSWFLRQGLVRPIRAFRSTQRDRPLSFTSQDAGVFFNAGSMSFAIHRVAGRDILCTEPFG
jgi:hypothetical protein